MTHRTVYQYSPPLRRDTDEELMKTLGTLGNSKKYSGTNWQRLETAIVAGGYWQAQINPQQRLSLSDWIDAILKLSFIRNDAAHRANTPPKQYKSLLHLYFGSATRGIGVFNGLVLAWHNPRDQNASYVAVH